MSEAARLLTEAWAEGRPTLVGGDLSDLPDPGVVLVSLRRLDRLVEVDVANAVLVCEAGTPVGVCRDAMAAVGLWCPPLRWLSPDVQIGAAVAAGLGRRSRRYGTTADHVLGLRFVSPAVGVTRHGGKSIKNATGFNLSGMLAGSRGELGVILEVTLRLVPRPRRRLAALYSVDDPARIWEAGSAVAHSPAAPPQSTVEPSSLGLAAVEGWLASPAEHALLLVEAEGGREDEVPIPAGVRSALGLSEATILDEGDRWPPVSGIPSTLRRRHAFNPADAARDLDRIIAVARSRSIDVQVLAELTGGAVEMEFAGGAALLDETVASIVGLPEPSVVARSLRATLKSAFDPKGLLRSS